MPSLTPNGTPTPTSSLNPFQMRFDLLHLAKDILETNAHMAREDKAKDRPSFYTTEQVILTAKELNAFISTK